MSIIVWLNDWLRQIIAIILLAGIIDLILPTSSYQRYVRLVIGLFILLTLLAPILKLLQGDFDAKLADSFNSWSNAPAAAPQMPSLQQIEQQAGKLQDDREAQARKITQRGLAASLQEEIERRSNLAIGELEVAIEREARTGRDHIVLVTVQLAEQARESGEVIAVVPPVSTIEAIEVSLPAISTEAELQDIQNNRLEPAESPIWLRADDERFRVIAAILMENWGVTPDRIRVKADLANG